MTRFMAFRQVNLNTLVIYPLYYRSITRIVVWKNRNSCGDGKTYENVFEVYKIVNVICTNLKS